MTVRAALAAAMTVGLILGGHGSAVAAVRITGTMYSDGVTGGVSIPHGWPEQRLYLCQLDVGVGIGGRTLFNPPGQFTISGEIDPNYIPGGTYGLATFNYDGVVAFSTNLNIVVPAGYGNGGPYAFHTPAHYSVMYNASHTEWGQAPWIWGTDFYQTFVATSPRITRIGTRLAGKGGDHSELTLDFGLYLVNDGPPSTWTKISPDRSYYVAGSVDPIIHIFWVPYRSNELTLTVGQRYAWRVSRRPGSAAPDFAIIARPFNGTDYPHGQLYKGDVPQTGYDAYGYVSGGTPGTVVNHAPLIDFSNSVLVGWSSRHGQRYQATGTSLAGVEIVYTDGQYNPAPLKFTFQVYDAVGGNPIGPAKVVYGAPDIFQGRAVVVWRPGEVPTTPGQFYYIEWGTPSGCNTWRMNEPLPGEGYVNRVSLAPYDLLMGIAEYEGTPPNAPVANFSASPRVNTAPARTFFTDLSTGTISTRTWNFGDGNTSTETNPTHTYLLPGTYTVTLTVSGPGGTSVKTEPNYIVVNKNVGDLDRDGDVDLTDFGYFQECVTGRGIPQTLLGCTYARMDTDEDVDDNDLRLIRGCLTGEEIPANPNCVP